MQKTRLTKEQRRKEKKRRFKITKAWLKDAYELKPPDTTTDAPASSSSSPSPDTIEVLKKDVYQHYLEFCESTNLLPVANSIFGKALHKVFKGIKSVRKGPRGKALHHYKYLTRKDPDNVGGSAAERVSRTLNNNHNTTSTTATTTTTTTTNATTKNKRKSSTVAPAKRRRMTWTTETSYLPEKKQKDTKHNTHNTTPTTTKVGIKRDRDEEEDQDSVEEDEEEEEEDEARWFETPITCKIEEDSSEEEEAQKKEEERDEGKKEDGSPVTRQPQPKKPEGINSKPTNLELVFKLLGEIEQLQQRQGEGDTTTSVRRNPSTPPPSTTTTTVTSVPAISNIPFSSSTASEFNPQNAVRDGDYFFLSQPLSSREEQVSNQRSLGMYLGEEYGSSSLLDELLLPPPSPDSALLRGRYKAYLNSVEAALMKDGLDGCRNVVQDFWRREGCEYARLFQHEDTRTAFLIEEREFLYSLISPCDYSLLLAFARSLTDWILRVVPAFFSHAFLLDLRQLYQNFADVLAVRIGNFPTREVVDSFPSFGSFSSSSLPPRRM